MSIDQFRMIVKGIAMAETPEIASQPEIIDVQQALRRNYVRMTKDLLLRAGIVAALVIAGGAVETWGPEDSPLMGIFIVPATFVLIFTVFRFAFGTRLVKCRTVLRHYPLEFHAHIAKNSVDWTKYGDVFTFRVASDNPSSPPLLRGAKAIGGRRWPKGTEGGVWVAGDMDFGGVILVPGSEEMLFFQPADWDGTTPVRERAEGDRVEKAARARLLRKAV